MSSAVSTLRDQFPALDKGLVFFENAGGSQVPSSVIKAMSDYMQDSYVQLGAPYGVSAKATATVEQAHQFALQLMGGEGIGQAILGPSTTQLTYMLADCYSQILKPGDAVVITENAHEANAGPWKRLKRFGIEIRVWPFDPVAMTMNLADLEPLLADGKVKLVAFPHVSNLLGEVVDVQAITQLAHSKGAKAVADGVAYAPHRLMDVAAWGVDWYVFSAYKVYGPHMAALFGTHEALAELQGPNHFFLPEGTPYKFEVGGVCHESCAGLIGMGEYLQFLAGSKAGGRETTVTAFKKMEALESEPLSLLLDYLRSRPDLTIIGPRDLGANRVPTVSFISSTASSASIAQSICDSGYAVRNGHMYAYDLVKNLGLDVEDGVVRVSMVHYNTSAEVEGLVKVLEGLR